MLNLLTYSSFVLVSLGLMHLLFVQGLPKFIVDSWNEEKKQEISEELTKCHDHWGKIYLGCTPRETIIGEDGDMVWIDIRGRHISDAIGLFVDSLFHWAKVPDMDWLCVVVGCNVHGVGNGILKQAVLHVLKRDYTIKLDPDDNVIAIKFDGRTDYTSILKPASS